MTKNEIRLPDELAERARNLGLLSDGAIPDLLEDAMRRQSGMKLLDLARRIHEAGIRPMSMEEIDMEAKAVRAGRNRS